MKYIGKKIQKIWKKLKKLSLEVIMENTSNNNSIQIININNINSNTNNIISNNIFNIN